MTFDYVIVGSGSAGSLLAGRLSENPRHRVLMLEAGPSDRRFWVDVPLGYGMAFYDPAVNWMYDSEPIPGLNGRTNYYPRGKIVGGSSSINAMVYMRGRPDDFDDWEAMGNPGWGWRDVKAAYRRLERHFLADGDHHGGEGALTVTDGSPFAHPLCKAFFKAGEEVGLPYRENLNGVEFEGVGYFHYTIAGGRRMSSARAFLRPALGRPNLRLETGALVTRLIVEGGRAIGVEYRKGSQTFRARAARDVILSAGAINTPQIMQLSGLGPADVLQRAGVPLVADLPAVGRHMQDHLCYDHAYRATVPTLNSVLRPWASKLWAGLRYLATRGGPLATGTSHAGGYARSRPDANRCDLQLYFSPLSYERERPRTRAILQPDPFPAFLLSVSNCRPASRGSVSVRSPDPLEAPAIRPDFLSAPEDLAEMVAGARLMRRLAATPALKAVIAEELKPGPAVSSDDDFEADVRARAYSVFHPCGTCRMGPDPKTSVVDARLRVHGMQGLRVIDASVFPAITTGNINAPTIMVAEKAAEYMLEDAA